VVVNAIVAAAKGNKENQMFNIDVEELDWAGKRLRIETGRLARQADGAVLVTYGETTVIATAVAERSAKPGVDFFPLTVNYQEKTYAAGKIPGGYFKREGRPTEKETLVSRLIDRPIRPLFVAMRRRSSPRCCPTILRMKPTLSP
jgi:polyribonucleotide nucleotidyltransferase